MKREERSPIGFAVDVRRLPNKGFPVTIEADEAQRRQLAEAHGLEQVIRFEARLLVSEWKRDGVAVRGTVEADIVQACIVTLDPVAAHLSKTVDELFVPERSGLSRPDLREGGEMLLDAEGPDAPEVFAGDTIDVGAVAEEIFALAIDPYPRKPDAVLQSAPEAEGPEDENSLRAQLQRLTSKR